MKTLILLLATGLLGCNGVHKEPNVELIQDMMESPAIKAQEYDETSPNHSGMRAPPENTVPQGFTPYKYGLDVERASRENKNPMAGATDVASRMTGQKFYETNCMVCHGMNGEGGELGNSIGDKMARKPPSLNAPHARGMSDGQIYHIISKGQGMMGPYESHIPQAYRWQVVNYVRELQQKATK